MAGIASRVTGVLLAEEIREETEQSILQSASSSDAPTADDSPSWSYRAANAITYALEKALCMVDGSKWAPKSPYLQGNYSPVQSEIFRTELTVIEGSIPQDLNGAFVRVGPNPYFDPTGRYHWFDGDGMAHVVRLNNGSAAYCNRWVDTARLQEEKKAGYAACSKIGNARGISGIFHILLDLFKIRIGVISSSNGLGTGNTALAFHAGRLLTLNEGDLPYQLRIACDGLLSTVERVSYGGALGNRSGGGGGAGSDDSSKMEEKTTTGENNKKNFFNNKSGDRRPSVLTAHPKIDPETGEMFAFGYSVEKAPYLWFTRFNAQGEVVSDIPVPGLRGPIMMHDFALTKRHVIFIDAPLFFKPENMVKKGTLPFEFDKNAPLRLGVLDRYATSVCEGMNNNNKGGSSSQVQWFTLDPGMCFHVANAWDVVDDPKAIEVYLCTFKDFSLDEFTATSADSEPYLTRVRLDLATGQATSQKLLDLCGDFPVVPASKVALPTRYAYVATFETSPFGSPVFYGVAKVDLQSESSRTAMVGLVNHGAGRVGGECYFVPRESNTNENQDEDDGYLMTIVYDEKKDKSELVIYDAKTMSSTPLARVDIGTRVPYGFHCTYVTENQLQSQI